jgi:hypothetical protein
MSSLTRTARLGCFVLLALIAACSGQKESAQKLIGDIDTVMSAAAPEAAKYVPQQLAEAQARHADLKASFAGKDYAAVLNLGPDVLGSAAALATAAAAKKDEMLKALNEDWSALARTLPDEVTALEARFDGLARKPPKKGVDLGAARSAFADANSLWSKAQAAFAAGNLEEAVGTAKRVKGELDRVAGTLKATAP